MGIEYFTIENEKFSLLYNLLYAINAFTALIFAFELDIKNRNHEGLSKYLYLIFTFFFILLIGLRDYSIGTDTSNYYLYNWVFDYPPDTKTEVFFYFLLSSVKAFCSSFTYFLILVSSLFFTLIYLTYKNVSKYYNANVFLIQFVFFSMFFSVSMSTNVIRQGLSLAILVFAYSLFVLKGKKWKIFILIVLSLLTHSTSIIPLMIFIILLMVSNKINLKIFYGLYLIGVVLSALNVGILNIAPFLNDILAGDRRITYLTNDSEIYTIGFKPQFVFFNSAFLLLFLLIKSSLSTFKNNIYVQYSLLLKFYIVLSVIFFMTFQIPYSDRWGLFSWVTIPILLAPAFSKNIYPKYKFLIITFLILTFISYAIYAS